MKRHRTFYVILYLVVLVCLLLGLIQLVGVVWVLSSGDDAYWEPTIRLGSFYSGVTRTIIIPDGSPLARKSQHNCTYHSCFDVYRCGYTSLDGLPQISVYVYPATRYVDEVGARHELPMSHEFASILQAIVNSEFYTSDVSAACLLVPSIDLLNQNYVRPQVASQILASLHRCIINVTKNRAVIIFDCIIIISRSLFSFLIGCQLCRSFVLITVPCYVLQRVTYKHMPRVGSGVVE